MNLLVDINHPAHVHLFRHAIQTWQKQGHTVIIAARNKEVSTQLLDAYHLKYHLTTNATHSLWGKMWELIQQDIKIYRLVRENNIHLALGTSVGISHISRITPCKSLVFNENDMMLDKSSYFLSYPFADAIITPDCIRDKRTRKYYTYPSYQELAYLHPDRFTPDESIFSLLDISPGECYFILRFVAFKADHDIGHRGISPPFRRHLIKLLSEYGRVFITSESQLDNDLEPYKIPIPVHQIHDAISFASMVVGDSETMCTEAAMLGVPAIRCNTFVGQFSISEELEHHYGLSYGFLPDDEKSMINKIEALLKDKNTKEIWHEKKEQLLKEKVDLTAWMVNFIEEFYQRHFK